GKLHGCFGDRQALLLDGGVFPATTTTWSRTGTGTHQYLANTAAAEVDGHELLAIVNGEAGVNGGIKPAAIVPVIEDVAGSARNKVLQAIAIEIERDKPSELGFVEGHERAVHAERMIAAVSVITQSAAEVALACIRRGFDKDRGEQSLPAASVQVD